MVRDKGKGRKKGKPTVSFLAFGEFVVRCLELWDIKHCVKLCCLNPSGIWDLLCRVRRKEGKENRVCSVGTQLVVCLERVGFF